MASRQNAATPLLLPRTTLKPGPHSQTADAAGSPRRHRQPDAIGHGDRYARQVRFGGIGPEGQRRLSGATVCIVGVGALGSHVASGLARAGVGRLIVVDRDVVDVGNLQRQVLFSEADAAVGRPKAAAAAAALRAANSEIAVDAFADEFDAALFASLPSRPELLIDGTDNFATRYLINDLALRGGLPWIHGGVLGAGGTGLVVLPDTGPCLRCWLPAAPPAGETGTCETEGVLQPAVAMVAAFQTAEALKVLVGAREALTRGVVRFDVWSGRDPARCILDDVERVPGCPGCGTRSFPALTASAPDAITLCGRGAVQVRPPRGTVLDLATLARRLSGTVDDLRHEPQILRFSAEGCRFSVFPGGRALLFGIGDPARARSLYDRFVGAR